MSKGRSLPGYSTLTANYPVDSDSAKVIQQIGGDLTQSWVGSNSCVMRMCKAFNYAGKEHAIPKPTKQFLTLTGADKKWYGIRVIEFIDYLRNTYCPPDLVKKGADMVPTSFDGKKGIIAWHIDGWSDARGHFTLWDGSKGLFEGTHNYFKDFGPSAPKNGPHMTMVEFWTC